MPQKSNGHGMQNYIPAGHGDASGEYGDSDTGSNVHVKLSDNEDKTAKLPIVNKNKIQKTQENLNNVIINTIGKLTPNAKALIKNIEESNADPKYIDLMTNLYETGKYKIKLSKTKNSCYDFHRRTIELGADSLKEFSLIDPNVEYYAGENFFHESGLALDHTYYKNFGKKIDEKGNHITFNEEFENQKSKAWSYRYKSKKYNMTLGESVQDELSKFHDLNNRNILEKEIDSFKQKFENEKNEIKKQEDVIELQLKKYDKEVDKFASDYAEKKTRRPLQESLNDPIKRYDFEQYKRQGYIEYRKINKEYGKLCAESERLFNKHWDKELEKSNEVYKTYGNLSDMIQAETYTSLGCGGHKYGYYNEDRSIKQATECFAEITSSKAVNKKSYETLKKYIPRTLEIYEEIIGEIENEQ